MRSFANTIAYALAAGCVFFTAAPALAQNVAVADALFKKGLADMQAGQYATGCPALGESFRIDPQPGTLFTLAECHAKAGNVATARARYEDYLQFFATLTPEQQQRQRGREKIAAAKRQELLPDVPLLTVTLSSGTPPGTRVFCDNLELNATSLGIALPLDPGDHDLRAEAPGGGAAEEKFTLKKGEMKAIELHVVATPASVSTGPKERSVDEGDKSNKGLSKRQVAAVVVGGVGLAAVGAGIGAGVLTQKQKAVIDAHCMMTAGKPDICDTTGVAAHNDARTLGWVSTGGFILGGLSLGTAAVLFFLKPAAPSPPKTARIVAASFTPASKDGAGLLLSGVW